MADICLLVEGAYPYVTGGVSSWLHALINNLSNFSFALVHVGARPDTERQVRYTLPANVVEFREVFTGATRHNKQNLFTRKRFAYSANNEDLLRLHEAIALGKPYNAQDLYPLLQRPGFAGLSTSELLYAADSWKHVISLYQTYAYKQPFVDFFWTFRQTYLPLLNIVEAQLPEASVYHAVSTGFCGLLGALAKLRRGRPFLVTEHGLYTREREIEIAQSSWLEQLAEKERAQLRRMNFFQEWWLNMYRFMERISYDTADAVISITEVNQVYQRAHGARPERMHVIPNGINTAQLDGLRLEQGEESEEFRIGFVGRVVSIKDVKTFVRAIKIASETISRLQVYIVGPTDEEADYYAECRHLITMLNLEDVIHITGPADVKQYYRKIDVLVLTSLSEGQPLVVLEANSAGIPVVATEVGACRELLLGITAEDQALGASGLLTPVASPPATAQALTLLWQDRALRVRMGRAGRERVRRFYGQDHLYQTYTSLYTCYIFQKALVSAGSL